MRWFLWWFGVLAAYVITVGAQNASEVIAGAIIAVPCTILVLRALTNARPGVRVYWRWLQHLAALPARMVSDALLVTRRVLWALVTGERLVGYFVRIPYEPGDRESDVNMGREALAVYGVCTAPNSIVAEVDLRGELVIHKLVASEQPAQSREWPV